MVPKLGSIGKGIVGMGRRKSWKSVEPYEASPDGKDDLSETSEDAYIQTFRELLADSAPSWSAPSSSRRPTYIEQDHSLDESESILSDALFVNESKANEIADRLQTFKVKKNHTGNDSQSSGKSTVTTRSSTNAGSVDSSQSSNSKPKSKGLSRSMSFDGRPRSTGRTGRTDSGLRSSWAERKHPKQEGKSRKSEAALVLFTPDNPPPPPPRPDTNTNGQSRRFSHLCPPPPPPPPAPLKIDFKARRLSSGEFISRRNSRRMSKSLTESSIADRRHRRVSFQDEHPALKKKLSTTFADREQKNEPTNASENRKLRAEARSITESETCLSGLKKMERRNKRASISSTSVVVPRSESALESRRPKELSKSFHDNIYSGPSRKDSVQESFSSSMPDVLSEYKPKPNASFCDDSVIPKRQARGKSNADDEEWTEIISAVENRTEVSEVVALPNGPQEVRPKVEVKDPPAHNAHPTLPRREASFNSAQSPRRSFKSHDGRARSQRPAVSEVNFDDHTARKASSFHEDFSCHTRKSSFQDNAMNQSVNQSRFREGSACFSVDSKHVQLKAASKIERQDETRDVKPDKEPEVSTPTKDKTPNDTSILSKISLPFRNRSGSIDDKAKEKSSNKPKYDKNGRCKKHPSIIIAKKRPFAKGWDTIQTCPRCSQSSSVHQISDDYCVVGVDELLAPSNKTYDWQLSSSFTSTKSNDLLAKSDALRSAASLSEAASQAIAQSGINDSPMQRRSNVDRLGLSARSGSSRQFSNSTTGSSRKLTDSMRSVSLTQLDSSMNGSMHSDSSRQLDYYAGNCSSEQLYNSTNTPIQFDNSLNSSSRSGSARQFHNSMTGSSRHMDCNMNQSPTQMECAIRSRSNSFVGGYPSQIDYSARSEGHANNSRQLDYSTRSEGYGARSEAASTRHGSSAIVSKMPYKTPWGQAGWYSGEVDNFGVPNGEGRMRFKSGEQHAGEWSNGYSEQHMENSIRMKRGFGTNVAPWKENSYSDLNYNECSSRSIRT